ncbi:Tkl protein kinase, partial [Globisporangium splendens]
MARFHPHLSSFFFTHHDSPFSDFARTRQERHLNQADGARPIAITMTALQESPQLVAPPTAAAPLPPSPSRLLKACYDGHLDTVNSLLKALEKETAKTEATFVNFANGCGRTPLFLAAWNGHVEIVRALVARGASVNATCIEGETPLFRAAERGHVAVVNALIVEFKAEVDRRKDVGLTPLSVAAREGHAAVVKVLLDQGAEVNQRSRSRQSPLHLAAGNGNLEVVRLLIERGATVDIKDNCGETPLFYAVRGSHLEVLAELVRCGASINVTSYSARTPLSVASCMTNAGILTDALNGNWRSNGIMV